MLNFIRSRISSRNPDLASGPVTTAAVSAATCIGSRSGNQDTFRAGTMVVCSPSRKQFFRQSILSWSGVELFCICDGVGGAYKGDAAAKGALLAIDQYLRQTEQNQRSLSQVLLEAAEAAQQWVQRFYRMNGLPGGCTLTMVGIRADEYAFLNIGDSPAFLLPPDHGILEMSCRHNLAWENLRNDLPVHAGDDSRLLAYLGMPGVTAERIAHTQIGILEPGCRILLCSDGITNVLAPESLEQALRSGMTALEIARNAAVPSDADNCTLVCLEILSTP